MRTLTVSALVTIVLFAAGVAAAGVDLKKIILRPGQCVAVAKVKVCAAKAQAPRTITSPPRTITLPPVTVTTPPVTVTTTLPAVTGTSPTVTVTVTTGPDGLPVTTFRDGTYRVGKDIVAGTYRNSDSSQGCYWERLTGFGGALAEIIANEFTHASAIVTIAPSDVGFSSKDCGTWTKIG